MLLCFLSVRGSRGNVLGWNVWKCSVKNLQWFLIGPKMEIVCSCGQPEFKFAYLSSLLFDSTQVPQYIFTSINCSQECFCSFNLVKTVGCYRIWWRRKHRPNDLGNDELLQFFFFSCCVWSSGKQRKSFSESSTIKECFLEDIKLLESLKSFSFLQWMCD